MRTVVGEAARCGCWTTRENDSTNPFDFRLHPCLWHAEWLCFGNPVEIVTPDGKILKVVEKSK